MEKNVKVFQETKKRKKVEVPDGWILDHYDEDLDIIDSSMLEDEAFDEEDYINTYKQLYSRELNGEYFYPDEDEEDLINVSNIAKKDFE